MSRKPRFAYDEKIQICENYLDGIESTSDIP